MHMYVYVYIVYMHVIYHVCLCMIMILGVIMTVSYQLKSAQNYIYRDNRSIQGTFGHLTNQRNLGKSGINNYGKNEESVADISMSVYFIFSS